MNCASGSIDGDTGDNLRLFYHIIYTVVPGLLKVFM